MAVAAGYALHWGWRRFLSSAVTLSLLLVALSHLLVAPASLEAAIIKHDAGTYTLREGEVIDNDLIVIGKRVVIEGTVIGDLIVCAASVDVSGEVQGDILGFAERVEVNGASGVTCASPLARSLSMVMWGATSPPAVRSFAYAREQRSEEASPPGREK